VKSNLSNLRGSGAALPLIPIGAVAIAFFALAWREQGSILAEDWLGYALASAFLAATIVASGSAFHPRRALLVGLGALLAFAAWTAVSGAWSPVPAHARDEALLILFYAVVLAIPLLVLRSDTERTIAVAIVVGASICLVVATSARLLLSDSPADHHYWTTRLGSPIRYPGADAAIFLVSFWPAVALAASRRLNLVVRTVAFAGATALAAGLLMTQSRAGAVSLGISAVVVFALAPARLRLLVPSAVALALALAAYFPLTGPFQEEGPALDAAVRDAGTWALLVPVGGVVVGILYALVDRRLSLPPRLVRAAGVAALAAVVAGAIVGVGGFFATVDEPRDYLSDRWRDFKRQPDTESGSSHLVTIGSNRYDFWRVALSEFREHPFAGAGGGAFAPVYLREGRTLETPLRAHSVQLDVLSETGLLGFVLLMFALLPFGWTLIRRARVDLITAGVLGAAAYWLVQATADWTWTFPAAGIPFFLLLGAATAGAGDRRIASSVGIPLALAMAATALLAFGPPWLSSQFTASALGQSSPAAADELRWARRFDPLSIAPLIAEAELATSPAGAIPPLEKAVEREPRSVAPRYLLGNAYLDAGRVADARRELREARRLAPRSVEVQEALRRAEAQSGRG
jgi:O-Antigen ligase/Tetratricopeptide repeat